MKFSRLKSGFTLIEMIVVVGVIIILAAVILTTATRAGNKAKEQLTKNTLEILNAALDEFSQYGYQYKGEYNLSFNQNQREFYSELKFPLDCNGFDVSGIENELDEAMDASIDIDIDSPGHLIEDSGSAVMYFLLSRIPQAKKILSEIDGSLIKQRGSVTVNGRVYPWTSVVDAWGTPVRYDLYYEAGNFQDRMETRRSFPLIISAGADKEFGTGDDVSNE